MTKNSKRNQQDMFPTPLKDKTARELAHEVLTTPAKIADSFTLGTALDLAFYAHDGQFRHTPIVTSSGKIRIEDTEYIYHPLRNTVRLMRWGVTDMDVLIGSILHDTVEDSPKRIREWGLSPRERSFIQVDGSTETENQTQALRRVKHLFGAGASHIVNAVTNPLPSEGQTKADRNRDYVNHVSIAVRDPKVFLVKFSDICDNALSLHFTPKSKTRRYLAGRYLPLAPILETAFCGVRSRMEDDGMVSAQGLKDIERRVGGMEKYLTQLKD